MLSSRQVEKALLVFCGPRVQVRLRGPTTWTAPTRAHHPMMPEMGCCIGTVRLRTFFIPLLSLKATRSPLVLLYRLRPILWYLQHVADQPQWQPRSLPWYPHKLGPSFRDMLAAIRKAFWQKRLSCNSLSRRKLNKLTEALTYALCEAA